MEEMPEGKVVYFIQPEAGGLVKIGKTKDLRSRFRDIQAMCPLPLRVIGWLSGYTREETTLHQRYASLRAHGEWFRWEEPLVSECPRGRRLSKVAVQISTGRVPELPRVQVYGEALSWNESQVRVLLKLPKELNRKTKESFLRAGLLQDSPQGCEFTEIAENCRSFHFAALNQAFRPYGGFEAEEVYRQARQDIPHAWPFLQRVAQLRDERARAAIESLNAPR